MLAQTRATPAGRSLVGGATDAFDASDRAALARLLAYEVAVRVNPSEKAQRALRDYRHRLVTSGRGELVALARDALTADGGRFVRVMARACPNTREAASAAALMFIGVMAEHRIQSTAARSLLVRWALESTVVDSMLAAIIAGDAPTSDAARANILAGSARSNLSMALRLDADLASTAPRPSPVSWPPAPAYTRDEPTDDTTPNGEGGCDNEAPRADDDQEHEHADSTASDVAHTASTDAFEGAGASSSHTRAPMSGISGVPLGNLGETRNLNFQPAKQESREEFPEELFEGFDGEASDAKECRRRQMNVKRAESIMNGPPVVRDATRVTDDIKKRVAEMERRVRMQQRALANKE